MTKRTSIGITYTEEQLMSDFSVSDWLKNQLVTTKNRDVLDSLRDAELLQSVLEQRCISAGIILKQ